MDVRYDARDGGTTLDELLQSYPKLGEALKACSLRFIINLPEESLRDAPRLCFELQEAFWFYLDYLYEGAKRDLPKLNQNNFCNLMLQSSDILRSIYHSQKDKQQLFFSWREYCRRVPLRGAVLLNARWDKCLMVQPWKGDKWSFPRGKINENESECDCAVREVWEETGIDISGKVSLDDFVAADVYGTGCALKLFLVPGIPEEVPCAPNTRREISKIGWVSLFKLPGWDPEREEVGPLRFFAVEPFAQELRRWVEARGRSAAQHTSALSSAAQGQGQGQRSAPARGRSAAGPAVQGGASAASRRKGSAAAKVREAAAWSGGWQEEGGADSRPPDRDRRRRSGQRRPPPPKEAFLLDMARVMQAFDRGCDARLAAKARA